MPSVSEYEASFRRAGLPLFIEGYSATKDVFTRALPFLTLVFLLLVFGAINLRWSTPVNAAAFLGGIALLVGTFGLLNVIRGRPFRSVPRKVGLPELGAFVVLPAALPLIFGGQLLSAAVTLLEQLALLGLVYLVVGFGVLSILRWAALRLVRELGSSLRLLLRAIPLLLFFALLHFLTTEMWQVFAELPRVFLIPLAGFFVLLGSLFLYARLPAEVEQLERETKAAGPPLRRGQRVNVGLVLFTAQALQILMVTLGVGLFFVLFGSLTISDAVLRSWTGSVGHTLWAVQLAGHAVRVTEELLVVAGAIAAFSGLYFAIASVTDATYRTEFLEALIQEMRVTFEDRRAYLALRSQEAPHSDAESVLPTGMKTGS
ncbi:MAG TPA: hypothetical protein VKA30_09505 [Actinomycetota bacterium]|nr:hypothetical protein [Actinomycetota bacterium]